MTEVLNLINGQHVASDAWLDLVSPATGEIYGRLPRAATALPAIMVARDASESWRNTPVRERSRLMHALADAIESDLVAFAEAESIDTGKPVGLARTVDIPRAVANLRWFADSVMEFGSEHYQTGNRAVNEVKHLPVGVIGAISPWNLPLYLFTWKIAPALATGNTVVAKPSELAPVTAWRLGQLAVEVGFPPGVLNIVHGLGAEVGESIVQDDRVGAITFTGGTVTGRRIAEKAASQFKKVSLEMGGKNPTIIFADADLDSAIATASTAAFANQGEICLCGERLLVHQDIHDEVVAGLCKKASELVIGDPLEPETQFGALISSEHRDRVESMIQRARDEGGQVVHGGGRPGDLPERCRNGFFLEPTIITGLDMTAVTNREEIFGPVVSVMPFASEAQAVEMANDTDYGLSAALFTGDQSRAARVAPAIEAGTVWVNCWLVRDFRVPFGGVKHSGLGREGGDDALRFCTEAKTICTATSKTSGDVTKGAVPT
ncbi:MAG: aldehyde dehydrogenase [Phycisphaerales bacterium]|nr:aldehyde dehydrogenase [Phycisphaerales bacterium]